MNSISLVSIGAAVLAGSAAAAITSAILSPDGQGTRALVVGGEPDLAGLQGEVDDLRTRNEDLALRLAQLEGSVALGGSRAPADAPDLTVLRERVDQLVAATTEDGPVVVTAQLRSGVTAVLDEIKLQEDQEREVRRQEARDRRMDQQIERLSERLGLDSAQATDMRAVLVEQDLAREEIFATAREFGDREGVGDLLGGLKEETLLSLSQILTPDQLERYSEQTSDRNRRGSDRARGGNNNGGGRRGGGAN
ncbi:MAG: hypothetical protein CMJ84_18605 [Planctomycetes bacterium]|jgi:hypothetical protein|nr:hypothetical protein [Planctomycetota bacterium]MDP6409723.1 hypothetical protein [Planctomycetota bacterium]